MDEFATYIGSCCREWILLLGFRPGKCGICGEVPTYLREDDYYTTTKISHQK